MLHVRKRHLVVKAVHIAIGHQYRVSASHQPDISIHHTVQRRCAANEAGCKDLVSAHGFQRSKPEKQLLGAGRYQRRDLVEAVDEAVELGHRHTTIVGETRCHIPEISDQPPVGLGRLEKERDSPN